MAHAIWNGAVIAESDDILLVEGNVYFPVNSVKMDYLEKSEDAQQTHCFWKGFAIYYDVTVDGKKNIGGAWYYDNPLEAAIVIKDRIAFWNGIQVIGAPPGNGLTHEKKGL